MKIKFFEKWQQGRQGTFDGNNYFKKLLLEIDNKFLGFDVYILKYPNKFYLKPHKDVVKNKKHYRLNIEFFGKGKFICEKTIFSFWRIYLFRPDINVHCRKRTKICFIFWFSIMSYIYFIDGEKFTTDDFQIIPLIKVSSPDENTPAIYDSLRNNKTWVIKGFKRHRLTGPAITWGNNTRLFFLNDKVYENIHSWLKDHPNPDLYFDAIGLNETERVLWFLQN